MSADGSPLNFMIEVYVNDYINFAMAGRKRDLDRILNATMQGMHSMFPANKVDSKDPISKKKMIKRMASGDQRKMFSAGASKE